MKAAEWHSNAMALLARGDTLEARNLLALALTEDPQNVKYLLDYAQVYVELGQYEKAEMFFGKALEFEPNSPLGNYRWGNLRKQFGHVIKAIEKYSLAIAADPAYVEAFNNRGSAYQIMGKLPEARADYLQAIELNPKLEEAYLNLGRLLDTHEELEAAARIYQLALTNGVNPDLFTHLFQAASSGASDKAPLGYVRAIYDRHASAFDMHFTQSLKYAMPALIGARVRAIVAQCEDALSALDLGCGTGLCGAEIATFVSHLAGVDVSPAMLDHADRRGIYHDLVESDIERYLPELDEGSIDLIVAAEVFICFGILDRVFFEVGRVLRPGGAFIFSIECLDDDEDYRLQRSGRFRHSVHYVERLAAQAGLTPYRSEAVDLQIGLGFEERGRLFTFRKRALDWQSRDGP